MCHTVIMSSQVTSARKAARPSGEAVGGAAGVPCVLSFLLSGVGVATSCCGATAGGVCCACTLSFRPGVRRACERQGCSAEGNSGTVRVSGRTVCMQCMHCSSVRAACGFAPPGAALRPRLRLVLRTLESTCSQWTPRRRPPSARAPSLTHLQFFPGTKVMPQCSHRPVALGATSEAHSTWYFLFLGLSAVVHRQFWRVSRIISCAATRHWAPSQAETAGQASTTALLAARRCCTCCATGPLCGGGATVGAPGAAFTGRSGAVIRSPVRGWPCFDMTAKRHASDDDDDGAQAQQACCMYVGITQPSRAHHVRQSILTEA